MNRRPTLTETMNVARMCRTCGLVDPHGDLDHAGNGIFWYCGEHLRQREDARLLPSQRVTLSAI